MGEHAAAALRTSVRLAREHPVHATDAESEAAAVPTPIPPAPCGVGDDPLV